MNVALIFWSLFFAPSVSAANFFSNCGATIAYLAHVPPSDRIVVVGMGALTPLGLDAQTTFENALAGASGVKKITQFDTRGLPIDFAGEINQFEFGKPKDYGFLTRDAGMGRSHKFAVAASIEAVKQSGLLKRNADLSWTAQYDPARLGSFVGATQGEIKELEAAILTADCKEQYSEGPTDRQLMFKSLPLASSHISIALGTRGAPILCPSSACASGSQAIAMAALMLPRKADLMIAGGSDAQLSRMGIRGREWLGALAKPKAGDVKSPEQFSRPFDRDREGFVMAEGAAVLLLATEAYAKAHQLKIHAYLAGSGMTSDAKSMSDPDPQMQALAMTLALNEAGLAPAQIGLVMAHATGTVKGDIAELRAMQLAYGEMAAHVPIVSIKGGMGHLLGASGSASSVVGIQAMNRKWIPPNVNLNHPSVGQARQYGITDDDMTSFELIAGEPMPADIQAIQVNSFGLGGQNVVLIFVKPNE